MSAARGEPPDGAPQVAVSSAEGRNNSGPSLMVAKPGASTQTILRGQVSRRPLAMRVRVEGVRARPVGVRLKDDKVVVGSQPPCDLVLADSTVSRKHVELELVPEGVRVTDLGSHNGTYYLGQRIERAILGPGAAVAVGGATLTFELDDPSLGGFALVEQDSFRGMLGTSLLMRQVFALLLRLEGSLVPTLVTGESGVGKELAALALHGGSTRQAGPFIAVNCAAIPAGLIQSELFGHRRGAFTGATESRKGAFECADGGTLFLDEIGELPLDLQPMLLRALETGFIQPLGEPSTRRVEVRLVTATNRDLAAEMKAGRFREDLYFRIAAVTVALPALRDRPEDIPLLARAFARQGGAMDLPQPVILELTKRAWPGNVRELRHAVLAYLALGELPSEEAPRLARLDAALLDVIDAARPYAEQKDAVTDRMTRLYLAKVLESTGFNQSAAARVSGLDRTYLGRLLAKHGLGKS
ncbi:MAG: sigma 54-dependent Fis family transcriptional regulator [Myxococcales bacterium]|nr:sigma 54-dependent Fis family transcriptional regulator [Myxococcales bacterium]